MSAQPQGYYAASAAAAAPRAPLAGDIGADVCVVGGGYTGLSAALHAARAGAKVVLVEAETIGFAASGRNGGQIHPGHRKDQAELERWLGESQARDLWRLSEEARALVFDLACEGCDLKRGLVIAAHNASAARHLAEDAAHIEARYGYRELRMLDRVETAATLGTTAYPAARFDGGGGHLHPLKFARRLAALASDAGAVLYEDSPALAIARDDGVVETAYGRVRADHVVLACDAFSDALAPELAPYIAHVESFLIATAPLGAIEREHPSQRSRGRRYAPCARLLPQERRRPSDLRRARELLESAFRYRRDGSSAHAEGVSGPGGHRHRLWLARHGRHHAHAHAAFSGASDRASCSVTAIPAMASRYRSWAARRWRRRRWDGRNVSTSWRVWPPRKFPGGPLLRKPMVTAALTLLKWADLF
ncbi:MAG: FAD-binding oxidoreductase [Rhizomicrobium sp.]